MNNTVCKYAWGLTKKMKQMENKVHQAMAVIMKKQVSYSTTDNCSIAPNI